MQKWTIGPPATAISFELVANIGDALGHVSFHMCFNVGLVEAVRVLDRFELLPGRVLRE